MRKAAKARREATRAAVFNVSFLCQISNLHTRISCLPGLSPPPLCSPSFSLSPACRRNTIFRLCGTVFNGGDRCLTTARANGMSARDQPRLGHPHARRDGEADICEQAPRERKRRGDHPPALCWRWWRERAKHCLTRTSARAHRAAR